MREGSQRRRGMSRAGSGVDVLEFPASVARLDTGLADVAVEEREKEGERRRDVSGRRAHISQDEKKVVLHNRSSFTYST